MVVCGRDRNFTEKADGKLGDIGIGTDIDTDTDTDTGTDTNTNTTLTLALEAGVEQRLG